MLGGSLLAAGVSGAQEAPAAATAPAAAPATPEDAATAFRDALRKLDWVKGPREMDLFGNSKLKVPAGYVFLNPAETAKFMTLTHNIGGGTQYFFAPQDLSWEVTFNFKDDGYVKDDQKIDADALLASIKENTVQANKVRRERGWDEMEVTGWQTPPHYDPESHRLEWAVAGRDMKTGQQVVNFNTRLLGRGGVMSAVLMTEPDSMTAATSDFKSTLTGFDYTAGQRYAEYKPGDKVAEYGLAALVTGGAAAIAVKTGLWKVILGGLVAGWKFIVAGLVAAMSAARRLFKRKAA
jgi:uncharacterized membrane-anchored protein